MYVVVSVVGVRGYTVLDNKVDIAIVVLMIVNVHPIGVGEWIDV